MDNLKKFKILAFIALFIELVIFFALFGQIRNLTLTYAIEEYNTILYALLIVAVVVVLFLFIVSINLTYKKISDKKNIQEKDFINNEDIQEELNEDQLTGDDLAIDNIIKKMIPKDNSKLDLIQYTEKILGNLAKEFDIVQGLFFVKEKKSDIFNIAGKYAYFGEDEPKSFSIGETLSGQVAKNQKILNLKDIPENYITILSGLGSSSPNYLLIAPIILNEETVGIIELASFKEFKSNFSILLEKISEQVGKVIVKY